MSPIVLAFALFLPAASVRAGLNRDAAFAAALDSKALALDADAAKRRARWDDKLRKWLGPYDAAMAAPGLDPAAMARTAADGIGAGRFDALILGESHGDASEQGAAGLILRAVAASPRPFGAVIFENTDVINNATGVHSTQYIFPDTAWLKPAGIEALGYKNHFTPEADLREALKAAGARPLASYTGSAHSAKRVKDYIMYTLGEHLGPYGRGLDMTTVEDVLRGRGRKPLIVSMITESFLVQHIQPLMIKAALDSEDRLPGLLAELDAAAKAWDARFQAYPPAAALRFVASAEQSGLFLGMTPVDRRPAQLNALLETLRAPELAVWLGSRKLKSLEAGRQGGSDAAGREVVTYHVVIRDQKGGEFTRDVTPAP
jgi:hypothetical protein